MKKFELSNLIGFKFTHLGVLMILAAGALANIISYVLELLVKKVVPFSTSVSIGVIIYIIEVLLLKLINKKAEQKLIKTKFNQLSKEEKQFVFKCCTEKKYFQTGHDSSFSSLAEFNETYTPILKVVTPNYISTYSTYRILPANYSIEKFILEEYKGDKQGF